jgi:thioesterase domain-containing protein
MARIAEAANLQVSLVALLDPRSLRPISIDLGVNIGLTDSLALISQTAEEGARYAGYLEELMKLDASERDAAIERLLSPAALAALTHVHQTSRWYAELLMGGSDDEQSKLSARVLLLQAREEWRDEPSQEESEAAKVVRAFQRTIFQASGDVLHRVSTYISDDMSSSDVPGGHFEMLREPGVVTIALQLCHALVEAVKS